MPDAEATPVEFDHAPFPVPYPEMTGIGPEDVYNVREWLFDKEEWEALHGKPDG